MLYGGAAPSLPQEALGRSERLVTASGVDGNEPSREDGDKARGVCGKHSRPVA